MTSSWSSSHPPSRSGPRPAVRRRGITMAENLDEIEDLRQRVERLEQLLGIAGWQPTPGFDPVKFQRILMGYLMGICMPLVLLGPLLMVPLATALQGQVSDTHILGVPLFNASLEPSLFGLTVGVIALGG